MKRLIAVAATAAVVLACAGSARADLCAKCRKLMYTMDIGRCVECGGATGSGAFKLCRACSAKLGQCEHCRAALGGTVKPPEKAAPANVDLRKSATYESGKWKYEVKVTAPGTRSEGVYGSLLFDGKELPEPKNLNDYYVTPWGKVYWTGDPNMIWGPHRWMPRATPRAAEGQVVLDPVAAERAEKLRAAVEQFRLDLAYFGEQDKPFYCVTLTVPVIFVKRSSPFAPIVQISKEEALKVIEHLGKDGYLGSATNAALKDMKRPAGPVYVLMVRGPAGMELWEELGWDLKMLARLDALRKALDGEAAKAMDLLIGRLSGLRKLWEAEKAKEAAEEFRRLNPDYAERAGAFYEKEYLPKALDALAAATEMTAEEKEKAAGFLKGYIGRWLDSYTAGGGKVGREEVERHLAALDGQFQAMLTKKQFDEYKKWRADDTGAKNAMRFLMTEPRGERVDVEPAAGGKEEAQLPGSRQELARAFGGKTGCAAAVMEATEEATVDVGNYTDRARQKFKVVEVLAGLKPQVEQVELGYAYVNVTERAVRRGERVVWVWGRLNMGAYVGAKAVADTEANRRLVKATAERIERMPGDMPRTQPPENPAQ